VPQDERSFAHLDESNALASGTVLPPPEPVFPRYVEQAEPA
jgi:methionyl-tRNA synthetase